MKKKLKLQLKILSRNIHLMFPHIWRMKLFIWRIFMQRISKPNSLQLINLHSKLKTYKLKTVFPNVMVTIMLFCTLPVTLASGESHSVLWAESKIFCMLVQQRNFETNIFWIGTASSILVRSLATWSVFVDQQKCDAVRINY